MPDAIITAKIITQAVAVAPLVGSVTSRAGKTILSVVNQHHSPGIDPGSDKIKK